MELFVEIKLLVETKLFVEMGVRKIAPEENFPTFRVRVWFRISFRIRAGGNFPRGNFSRTVEMID